MTTKAAHPLTLIILDGWGEREEKSGNAIAHARKPVWDKIWHNNPHTLISGSGKCVGLPDGQMGNSEVGHLNMGAGRIVQQDLTKIDDAIQSGELANNPILLNALTKSKGHRLHVMGLLSPGGVHSHEDQILALLNIAKSHNITPYFHAFLDGRDTPPQSAAASLAKIQNSCVIASIIGRYYAMDRDKRWDRVKKAYDLLVDGKAEFQFSDAIAALEQAYARGEVDEFVQATSIHAANESPITINDGDVVIFMNFRADRAREITRAITEKNFNEFPREKIVNLSEFVCLTEYDKQFPLPVIFPPQSLNNLFADYISKKGYKQLRIAETEKYAHVTFFFNGGIEKPFANEDRVLIPSPKVATYDLKPEMSAIELTDKLVQEIKRQYYDVIICNFANPDMVGHSGNFDATVKAIETIDTCLGKIITAAKETGNEIIITADHGNAEKMFDDKTQQPHTAHTSDPVPFIYIGRNGEIVEKNGKLSDIAPTMLYLLDLPKPLEMTGKTLLNLT